MTYIVIPLVVLAILVLYLFAKVRMLDLELDDASHEIEERQERDAFIDKVLKRRGKNFSISARQDPAILN